MQLFMSFYFWTLHLIPWLIYSKQRHNLQDCNKPGAQSWRERSQRHTTHCSSITEAIAPHWVTPGQCHQLQPWYRLQQATPGTHHPLPLRWGPQEGPIPSSCSKKPSTPSQCQVPPPCSCDGEFWHSSPHGWSSCAPLSNVRSASKGYFPQLV